MGTVTVGWLGLGKLGLPCALALGHHADVDVVGYDPDPRVAKILDGDTSLLHRERGVEELISTGHRVELVPSIGDAVSATDGLVFVAVPTPHAPEYGGETPAPAKPRDFDYAQLAAAVSDLADASRRRAKPITVVIVSTVLPGTLRRVIAPVVEESAVRIMYNPFFIAMGTAVKDFLHPEFVLVGADRPGDAAPLFELYHRLDDRIAKRNAEIRIVSWETAELTKVAYNTFISLKIVFANTLLEISDHLGADVDDVFGTLRLGRDRITGDAYLRGGVGDGGACHPRDNIAMSWLARHLDLSADPFEFVTNAREAQSEWLADRIALEAENRGLPIVLLGKAYKPDSDLTYGSPGLLLAHQLRERGVDFDHLDLRVDGVERSDRVAVYAVLTSHPWYETLAAAVPSGSAVVDPFRYVRDADGVEVVRLGENPEW